MVLWFVGLALVIVWFVFRDPALDHRLVAAGALLPLLDLLWRDVPVLHTLVASVALMAAVMVLTHGRRRGRRRLLAVPIGAFLHLVLDGAWTSANAFWWPLLGHEITDGAVGVLERPLALNLVMELAGVAALVWFSQRFGLGHPGRRGVFLRSGRLDRALAGPPAVR